MLPKLAAIFLLFNFNLSFGQYKAREQQLVSSIDNAVTDSIKIVSLGNLAEFYYLYGADSKGDSILQKQLLSAELSNNKNLIFYTLFGNTITNIGRWTSQETFDKTLSFLDKGVNYAKEQNNAYYEGLAYIRKAAILRKQLQYDKAIQSATLAFSAFDRIDADSLKAILYIEIGDIFMSKGETVLAYKNYNNSYDLAYRIKNISLQSMALHRYANIYKSLGNEEVAKDNLIKSRDLNIGANNQQGLFTDYIDIARLTNEKEYIHKALRLADTLKSERFLLNSKKLMLAYLCVVEKNDSASLHFLEQNDELKQSYLNRNMDYNITIGNIYRFSDKIDSAIYYYVKTLPFLKKSTDILQKRDIHKEIGECYFILAQYDKAIHYLEQSLTINTTLNDVKFQTEINKQLGNLYAKLGDYKKAYTYNHQYILLNDSLQTLSDQRDLVLMEVDRETQRHEKDLEDQEREKIRTRNIQYLGISIAITTVFFILMLVGAFPVSGMVIKMLGFFAFICLFEFIVLLIDSYLHKITHGEPLKIWFIKIFLILMLVPLQHYMEHGIVQFLASQKLLRMRKRFSMKKWMKPFQKSEPQIKPLEIEKDTAVL